ncbi:MAG: tRNA lysidine(34) synthetase TilS [Neisseriaceae bacterium]
MDNLVNEIILNYQDIYADKGKFTVGLSGGIDSVFLLHLFAKIRDLLPITVDAVHVNHGISSHALQWEDFCKTLCARLQISLHISRYTITKSGGESLENNARKVRYDVFSKLDSEVIILAHHKNDQVETMLSQMLRGSDLHNIAAMKKFSKKYGKFFWRPLLSTSRSQIESFIKGHKISYINDESNYDTGYLRNFVRHKLLPEMLVWDNTIVNKLINVTTQLQETCNLLDEIGLDDLLAIQNDDDKKILSVEKFKLLSCNRQTNVLSYYINSQKLPLPSKNKIQEFCRQVNVSSWDRYPKLNLTEKMYLCKKKNDIKIMTL